MNTQQQNSRLTSLPVVMFLAGICCFLWGSATPAIKTGYRLFQIQSSDAMSIILFAGMRFLLAGFLVILFHSIQGRRWIMPQKGSGRAILELCLNQTVLQYYFFYTGLAHASGVHGAIITGGNVFISILVASLIFRYEKLTARKLVGCSPGFCGNCSNEPVRTGRKSVPGISFRRRICPVCPDLLCYIRRLIKEIWQPV